MVRYGRLMIHQRFSLAGEEESGGDGDGVGLGGGDGGGGGYMERTKLKILSLLLLALVSCCFVMAPHIFSLSSTFSLPESRGRESVGLAPYEHFITPLGSGISNDSRGRANVGLVPYEHFITPLCSGISNGTICCDITRFKYDICIMKGDVRTHYASSSVFLFTSLKTKRKSQLEPKKIKPYTRKWETSIMNTIQELNLINEDKKASGSEHVCDVYHDVPAVFFSTGGYTGNLYHEFNDGIIPLYITSQHFKKRVFFMILQYHSWWIMKYRDIVSQLSEYPPVDFSGDARTHCFKEAIVGLRIHGELTVDSSLMAENKNIVDFRNLLDQAYQPLDHGSIQDIEEREAVERKANETISLSPMSQSFKADNTMQEDGLKKPKLVILSRKGLRVILNEKLLVDLAEELGFVVEVLKPEKTTELAKMYRPLNSSDVMIGVHGAAMTHFLFMKPKSVFIQIIPIGTDWAAETCYGEPAKKLGLKYIAYKIMPKESSLYDEYGKNDPILRDPDSFTQKGWEYTKKIYLGRQNVKLDLRSFRKTLSRAYDYYIHRITQHVPSLVPV